MREEILYEYAKLISRFAYRDLQRMGQSTGTHVFLFGKCATIQEMITPHHDPDKERGDRPRHGSTSLTMTAVREDAGQARQTDAV